MAGNIPEKKLILCGDDGEGEGDGDDEKFNEDTGREKLTLEPRRKKLLVFDLNGLLVYRVYCSNKPDVPSDRTPDGKFGNHIDPKGELGVYLDGLAAANNVQVDVKENPFGLPAISNDRPDWNFYSNALRGLEDKI